LPNSDSDCRILATITEFQQSDTKIQKSSALESGYQQILVFGGGEFLQMCVKMKYFKSKKHRFLKIKEAFTIKLKMIFVDHYFRLHQTPKNVENIFQKT